jgi:hypothetical protein
MLSGMASLLPASLALAVAAGASTTGPVVAQPRANTAPFGVFDVEAGPGGRELAVEARFEPGAGERLEMEDGMGAWVERAQVFTGAAWTDAAFERDTLRTPGCARSACRVRYRVLLERAARGMNRRSGAFVHGDAVLAPPSTWLIRPTAVPAGIHATPDRDGTVAPGDARYHLRVRTPPGTTFVSGLFRLRGAADTYALNDLAVAPYSGFAAFDTRSVQAGGGTVDVAIAPGTRALSSDAVRAWVHRCAAIIADYYGRAPLPRYAVIVLPGSRRPVGFGTAMGHGGGAILVWIGAQATEADLAKSWVLVHEMVHLGFPNVPGRQHWMEEGLATYVEEVARVRAGWISEEEFWGDLRRGFPKGLLQSHEQGLDGSRRWGPLYWGGALFWFLADIEIREKTGGARGLEDALRGVQAAGGSIAVWWPPEKAMEQADAAVGGSVIRGLYDRFGRAYLHVDLPALWARVEASRMLRDAVARPRSSAGGEAAPSR